MVAEWTPTTLTRDNKTALWSRVVILNSLIFLYGTLLMAIQNHRALVRMADSGISNSVQKYAHA